MPERIKERLERAIEERVFPGCVVGLLQDDDTAELACGTLTYGSEKATVGTLYDLASVTKSIPLATLVLEYAGAGIFSLSDPVARFIPELKNDYGATVEDLLRYRVRGPRMATLAVKTFEEVRAHVLERGFDGPPGESSYSNLPAFILGVMLERITGSSIAALAEKELFAPLAMTHTSFFPHPDLCAPSEIGARGLPRQDEVRGLPHDESAYLFAKARRTVGHAGLFSTAGDLLVFADALLSGRFTCTRAGAARGLGWQIREPHWMGESVSNQAFGKTGFTGTSIIIDPEKRKALVILSNRTYPHRPADAIEKGSVMNAVRREIAEIAFA